MFSENVKSYYIWQIVKRLSISGFISTYPVNIVYLNIRNGVTKLKITEEFNVDCEMYSNKYFFQCTFWAKPRYCPPPSLFWALKKKQSTTRYEIPHYRWVSSRARSPPRINTAARAVRIWAKLLLLWERPFTAARILITPSPKRDGALNEIIAIQWTQISQATPWQTARIEREREEGGCLEEYRWWWVCRCMFWCAFHGARGPWSDVGFILSLRG